MPPCEKKRVTYGSPERKRKARQRREMKDKQTETSAYEIDLLRIVKVLWSKAWIIAVSCILLGAVGFGYARWHVTPMYESSALMYVNNSSISLGGASVTIS
ncbi:MAG: hypothetical protein J5482_05195, partial [Oscillospiraceae bacterium]|nr:hypothetical protein [Oscillospiraceae bacterium]